METPDVKYAKSGDVSIAYAAVGDGPMDVVFVSGWILGNLDAAWEGTAADFYRGIASFGRLILFDRRGTGLSDR
ncbi:MAG: alpha/beta fold hydrolase, partial [Actinomycetota bacterium]